MQETRFDPWVGKIPWRRAWQPTPVFLPEESHRQRSLVGYRPQGCKELDMTGRLNNNNEGMCFPGGAAVKNLPAMQETQEMQIRALGREDPRKKEMATHSSIFAWKVPLIEEPGRLQSMGSQRVGNDRD